MDKSEIIEVEVHCPKCECIMTLLRVNGEIGDEIKCESCYEWFDYEDKS